MNISIYITRFDSFEDNLTQYDDMNLFIIDCLNRINELLGRTIVEIDGLVMSNKEMENYELLNYIVCNKYPNAVIYSTMNVKEYEDSEKYGEFLETFGSLSRYLEKSGFKISEYQIGDYILFIYNNDIGGKLMSFIKDFVPFEEKKE